ncbi:MAG TPA: hypothetical protein VLT33_08070 [Labilithrix sp.]|nr:hypothetical protein [Labilithrix sp.]
MDYRSPNAGLQRQVEELTEELASLQAAPGEAELAVPEDSELAKLRREARRVEARAEKHRKRERVRELTPRERVHFARMHGSGVLGLVLSAFLTLYLLVMAFLGAAFEDTAVYVAVTAGMSAVASGTFVLVARRDARARRAGRTAPDDFSAGDSD